jgi:hypothetical protein
MKKTLLTLGSTAAMFAPLMASAATAGASAQSIIGVIIGIVNTLIPFMLALALLAFFWGLVRYIWNSGDAEAQAAGKGIMIWGIIALFVMVAVWGLVGVVANTFNIGTGGSATAPCVTGVGAPGC